MTLRSSPVCPHPTGAAPYLSRRALLAGATAGAALRGAPEQRYRTLRSFDYRDAWLTSGPLFEQYRRLHASYLNLDNDRLLKVYRQRAGLPAPGDDMGGWYDADGFVPGHLLGQFISGLSRIAATTGDAVARAKVGDLVRGYAATIGPDGYPYASAKASTTWPCYILDKYEIGLLDAARLAGVPEALPLLKRVVNGALPYIPDHVYDRGPDSPKQAPYDEPYILPENLFLAAAQTGERRYLEMARKYLLDRDYFDPLASGRDVLPGKHAYSHVIALSSAAKAYEVLGETKYLDAIRNAWDLLELDQEFASGAWGPKEAFVTPGRGELGDSIASTHDHFETPCGYYAHCKLARYLLSFTGEARYGDGLEKVLFNTMLGATDPDGQGNFFYYSDYHDGARKGYYKRKWPCCAGTLLQSVADYPLNLYFAGADSLWANFYAGSRLRWKARGTPVEIVQTTSYPESEQVELRVKSRSPSEFTLRLRIPSWAEGTEIRLNGKRAPVEARPGQFARLRRKWQDDDTVEIHLPFRFRTAPVDSRHPDLVALMYGPLMMVALEPPSGLRLSAKTIRSLRPAPGRVLEFISPTSAGDVRWMPFYRVQAETYTTYLRWVRETAEG